MSTPPRPIRRRRVDWLPWSVALLLSVVFGAVGFVAGRSSAGRPVTIAVGPQQAAAAGLQDDGKAEVEQWLAENLDSGEWEEVRWWPAREAAKEYRRAADLLGRMADLAETPEQREYEEAMLEKHRAEGPAIVARMKYRTENRVGGTQLVDQVFVLRDGKVEALGELASEHYFREFSE